MRKNEERAIIARVLHERFTLHHGRTPNVDPELFYNIQSRVRIAVRQSFMPTVVQVVTDSLRNDMMRKIS